MVFDLLAIAVGERVVEFDPFPIGSIGDHRSFGSNISRRKFCDESVWTENEPFQALAEPPPGGGIDAPEMVQALHDVRIFVSGGDLLLAQEAGDGCFRVLLRAREIARQLRNSRVLVSSGFFHWTWPGGRILQTRIRYRLGVRHFQKMKGKWPAKRSPDSNLRVSQTVAMVGEGSTRSVTMPPRHGPGILRSEFSPFQRMAQGGGREELGSFRGEREGRAVASKRGLKSNFYF